jgi:hypothetical protein
MKNRLIIIVMAVILISISIIAYFVFTGSHYMLAADSTISNDVEKNTSETSDITSDALDVSKEVSDNLETSSKAYDGTAPVIFKMQEPLTIKSYIGENEQEKLKAVYDKSLIYCGWNGEMKFTVTGATMYDTFEETDITDMVTNIKPLDSDTNPTKYIIIDINIENISASANSSDEPDAFLINFLLETNNEFTQENFKEMFKRTNRYNWANYFSLHGQTDKDYYSFSLPQGSTVSAQLGFYVSQKALDSKELILNIGYTSSVRAFGIELNEIVSYKKGA